MISLVEEGTLSGGFNLSDYKCMNCWRDPVKKKVNRVVVIACPWSNEHIVMRKDK